VGAHIVSHLVLGDCLVESAAALYFRLILGVGPPGVGALRDLALLTLVALLILCLLALANFFEVLEEPSGRKLREQERLDLCQISS
jgi:hypothetical protein